MPDVARPAHTPNTPPHFLPQGVLWDFFRQLHAEGWSLDANGYTTSFRCVWGGRGGSGTGRTPAMSVMDLRCMT